jgi:hypothetical protein
MVLGPIAAQSLLSAGTTRMRVDLLGGVQRLEHAIDAVDDPSWRPGMTRAVAALRHAFSNHVHATEGPAGLYAGLLEDAPRLARGVDDLVGEHTTVLSALDALEHKLGNTPDEDPDIEEIRQQAVQVLQGVWQHRQRGADLVYEAYVTDLGGEN